LAGRDQCYTQGLIFYLAPFSGRLVAWAVAYVISCNFLLNSMLINWVHSGAFSGCRQIQLIAVQLHDEIDESGIIAAKNELLSVVAQSPDPWGNPYQVLNFDSSAQSSDDLIHVYSFGEDGATDSQGNDPDDINTWDSESGSVYRRRVNLYWEKQKLWQTAWTTPILLALAWLTRIAIVRVRRITMR